MNINLINERTGLHLKNEKEILKYMQDTIYYLFTHNKNYTQTQYYKIWNLKDIIDNMED